MASGAHSKWKARETRRAECMHKILTRVAKMGLTYDRMFLQARKLAGSGRFFQSYKRWEFLFIKWKKDPCPEVLMRKWRPGIRESSAEFVPVVVAFAIAARVTLNEAHRQLGLPLSYNTVFRHCKIRREIARLAAIRRAQDRLALEEKAILKKIKGGKRP